MNPQNMPDMSSSVLVDLERELIDLANGAREGARQAQTGRTRAIQYEVALCIQDSARRVARARQVIESLLAGSTVDPEHPEPSEPAELPWPIEGLEVTHDVHRGTAGTTPILNQRWPIWGVRCYRPGSHAVEYVSLSKANTGHGDMVLHTLLADERRTVLITQAQWAALDRLAARIGSQQPIPYDLDGSVDPLETWKRTSQ